MRTFRIILSFLAISCVVHAQEVQPFMQRKVTLNFQEASIDEVLKTLEALNEGLVFVYSSSTFDMKRKVSGSFEETTLKIILKDVFKEEFVVFQENRNKIIIKPKKQTNVNPRLQSSKKSTSVKQKTAPRPPKSNQIRQTIPPIHKEQNQQRKAEEVSLADTVQDTLKASTKTALKRSFRAKKVLALNEVRGLVISPRAMKTVEVNIKSESKSDSTIQIDNPTKRDSIKSRRLEARKLRQLDRQNEEQKFRIYGASYTGYTQVGGRAGIQMGGSLVWLKNKRWGFGLAGYAVQRSLERDLILSGNYRLAGGYGGLMVEYTLNPTKKFHFSFPIMFGGGGLTYLRREQLNLNPGGPPSEDSKAFFATEASANLEVNLTKYLRAGMGIGYRYTTNTTLNYQSSQDQITDNSALTGFNFGVTIKFGVF